MCSQREVHVLSGKLLDSSVVQKEKLISVLGKKLVSGPWTVRKVGK